MEHLYSKEWEYNGVKVIECESCGYKHLYPKPAQDMLNNYYKNLYHGQVKPFQYDYVDEQYVQSAKKSLDTNFLYNGIFNTVSRHHKALCHSMLDLGCGNNLISVLFKQRNWNSYVIEPSIDSFRYIQKYGIEGFNCFFEDIDKLDLPEMGFINIQYVLEHVISPEDVLLKARALLAENGIIRVVVPNDFNEGQLAYIEHFQKEPKWISHPDHINYFNFETMERFLKRLGFETIYKTTRFPLEMLLLSGIDYYNDNEARGQVGDIIRNFESAFMETGRADVLEKFYNKVAETGLGRAVEIYARKI